MSEVKLDETGLTSPSISLGDNTLSSEGDKLFWNGEEFKSGGGRMVGDQWISMDGTIPDGGLAFLGQTVSKTTYYELYNWVETHNRFKTEAEWQSLYSANNGNVSFYAKVDDNTFRMPSFKGYLKANETAGGYTKEGLPNITGTGRTYYWDTEAQRTIGAIYQASDNNNTLNGGAGDNYRHGTFNIDASRSSSIYGRSSHVTPETNTILIGVYAIVSVKNTSGYDLQEIINIAESTREGAEELISTAEQSFNESLESINNQINIISNNLGFIGEIKFSSYDSVPSGYLICDGSAVSRTTYSALFIVIGTKWGTGDGSTTFTLPNLIGRVAWGAKTAGTYKSAGLPSLPSHKHDIGFGHYQVGHYGEKDIGTSHACSGYGSAAWSTKSTYTNSVTLSNTIYGASTTVQPPAATVVPVIRYI